MMLSGSKIIISDLNRRRCCIIEFEIQIIDLVYDLYKWNFLNSVFKLVGGVA